MSYSEIRNHINHNRFSQAKELIANFEDDHDIIIGEILLANIYEKQGKINKALELAHSARKGSEEDEFLLGMIESNLVLSNILSRTGKIEDAMSHCLISHDLIRGGSVELQYTDDLIYRIYLTLGFLYDLKGKLQQAMEYYQLILQEKNQVEDRIIGYAYNNIGELYRISGEPLIAKGYYEKSLEIRTKLSDLRGVAVCQVNLGIIATRSSHEKRSIFHFKEAYEMFRMLENDSDIAESLYHYIISLLSSSSRNSSDAELADELLEELKLIEIRSQNQRITMIYQIVYAIWLKGKGRSKYYAEAQELLEKIRHQKLIEFEFYIYAMLNLAELLFIEYKMIQTSEVYDDLYQLILELYQIAQDQKSYSLLIQSIIIQAQMAYIDNDLEKSFLLLDQAEIIVDEHQLGQLGQIVFNVRAKLETELSQMNQMIQKNQKIRQKIEMSEISEYLSTMVNYFK